MENLDDFADLADVPAIADPTGDPAFAPTPGGGWTDPSAALINSEDAWWFEQSADGLCMPASCAMIFNQQTGQVIPEAEFVEFAQQAGLLSWDGTQWSGMTVEQGTTMLQLLGVEAQAAEGATIDDLDRWVDVEGRSVILAVDSDEVWYGFDDDVFPNDGGADHALRLAEVDTERNIAILEDPGNPAGRGYEISLPVLEEALADSGGQVIVTGPPMVAETEAPVVAPETAAPGLDIDLTPAPLDLPEPGGGLPLAAGAVVAAGVGGVILIRLVVDKASPHIQPRAV